MGVFLRELVAFFRMFPVFILLSLSACVETSDDMGRYIEPLSVPEKTDQLLLVTAPSWDDSEATLRLYSRTEVGWKMEGDEIPVVLGRNGLAWGVGLHAFGLPGRHKIEGDGRTPAGIFELGTVFGYEPQRPSGSSFPYRQATEDDYFIDDIGSPDYNRWVSLADSTEKNPHHFWKTFERMRRDDRLYELGIVVKHNMNPTLKGMGSAIFLHVWRGPGQPTAGCTAMSKKHLLTVIRRLDPRKRPLLVQLPEDELKRGRIRVLSLPI